MEVIGSVAPGATMVVYFSDPTARGFIDAVSSAVHDSKRPSVISISWGWSEDSWTPAARDEMEEVFKEAAALGITVVVAAGDYGSTDGIQGGHQHVDFPASAPHAFAVGGTSLRIVNGQITQETVWNNGPGGDAGGGGISDVFGVPPHQRGIALRNVDTGREGRGVPDAAASADPYQGYLVWDHGGKHFVGGTSAGAPLWAALFARCMQSLGTRIGFVNPLLYAASPCRDITDGDNGRYRARRGWDPCTGMGSPDGEAVVKALRGPAPVMSRP